MFSLLFYLHEKSLPYKVELSTTYLIGRHSSCNLVIVGNKHISRFHSSLILIADASDAIYCLIKDGHWMGGRSSNGTWVNGERSSNRILKSNDLITFASNFDYPRANFVIETAEEKTDEGTLSHGKDA